MSSELHSEHHDNCLVLTFRCGSEGLTPQMLSAGIEALNVAEGHDEIDIVILRIDGDRLILGDSTQSASQGWGEPQVWAQLVDAIRTLPKPVIAALESPVSGAGVTLVWACDLVIASHQAEATFSACGSSKKEDPHSWLWSDSLPRAVAQQFLWLPEPVAAERLHQLGLVNWLVAPGQALAKALTLGARLHARRADNGCDLTLSKAALNQRRRASAGI